MVDANVTFEEGSVRIIDNRDQVLQGKTMRLVKARSGGGNMGT